MCLVLHILISHKIRCLELFTYKKRITDSAKKRRTFQAKQALEYVKNADYLHFDLWNSTKIQSVHLSPKDPDWATQVC